MDSREYFVDLFRSPAGMVMAVIAVSAGAAATCAFGIGAGLGLGAASFAALVAAATATGLGPRAASAEGDRRQWTAARRHLADARAVRDRLASLRIQDTAVKALLELAAVRGSAYLAACIAAKSRDPRAEEALADCLAVADLYQRELDGASTERRYALEDADPFAAARERAMAVLRDNAAVIDKATKDLSGGLSPADAMEIKETL